MRILAGLTAVAVYALIATTQPIPVHRLVSWAEEAVAAAPQDPCSITAWGAFTTLPSRRACLRVAGRWHYGDERTRPSGGGSSRDPSRAGLDRLSPLYHLTLACILEQGAPWASKAVPNASASGWIEQAIAEYKRTSDLSRFEDEKVLEQPMTGLRSLTSYEAAESYIRLTKARGPTSDEQKIIAEMEAHLRFLREKPTGPVSPIIFRLSSSASANDLLDTPTTTNFDLDGTHRGYHWPWLKPDTALLVWDPNHTGAITSGRQLFGSVSWWIFWRDGY